MCYRDLHIYRQCQHGKHNHLRPCTHGFDTATQRCNAHSHPQPITNHVHYEPFPLLCPPCYRQIEAGICDKYDALFLEYQTFVSELRDVQARLKSDDETERQEALLAAEIIQCWKAISNHTDALRDVVRLIERFERKMQENREARMRELKGFRDRQGVWGDG